MSDEWKKIAELYDILYKDWPDINFWTAMARKYKGPILECACGTGRVAIPLAEAGFKVTGIDISKDMLDIFKHKIKKLPKVVQKRIDIKKEDMKSFFVGKMFRTAIIPFTSFLHLTLTKDQQACIKSIGTHISEGGILIVDVFNPDLTRPEKILKHDVTVTEKDRSISKFSSQTFNLQAKTTDVHFFIDVAYKDGTVKRRTMSFTLGYLFKDELVGMLEKAGFIVVEIFGDYNTEPFSERSKRIILVAKKILKEESKETYEIPKLEAGGEGQ